MRSESLLLVVLVGCNTQTVDSASSPPGSVRERMTASSTRMLISAPDSAGTITVQRRVANGQYETGLVDLKIDQGEVVAFADSAGAVTIDKLSVTLKPIEIPASVFNREAQLTKVRAELMAPVVATTAWADADSAHLSASLDLAFSWALTVEGNTAELGAPDLPPVHVEVDVSGDGPTVHADVDAGASGELWSWAGLIKLEDLNLVLSAETL